MQVSIGAPPDPGLEHLPALLELDLPPNTAKFGDVDGLRRNALWEAIFLFQKCSHTSLAAQRLAQRGMHSWCSFNAYHSAYIGARGIMTLLGVLLPSLTGIQVAIDLFPEPETKRRRSGRFVPQFDEFLVVRLPRLEQRYLWEGLQRVLRMTGATCWELALRKDILDVGWEEIAPPRNSFLYKSAFWPLGDLLVDIPPDAPLIFSNTLESQANGFLVRLSFAVYRLFEQLMADLASYSGVVKRQIDASRLMDDGENRELVSYRGFLASVREDRTRENP